VILAEVSRIHHHHVFPPQPWRVGCRCHRAVGAAPGAARTGNPAASRTEAPVVALQSEHAAQTETTALAMQVASVDFGRVIAVATTTYYHTSADADAGILTLVGVSRFSREKH
jgi:hypothetical protein